MKKQIDWMGCFYTTALSIVVLGILNIFEVTTLKAEHMISVPFVSLFFGWIHRK